VIEGVGIVHLISGPLRRIRIVAGVAVVLVVAGCSGGTSAPQAPRSTAAPDYAPLVPQLAGAVSADGAMVHLQALQQVADQHGGNRASGTPGYDASVDYVVGVLRDAGFDVSTPTYRMSRGDDGDARGAARNVVAQTGTGDPDHVVMIGAHLDSVEEGPGIVDDGSGVASLLEIATRLGTGPSVRNAVRFAFFGSEETGSKGSRGYLQGLSAADRAKIELYLNVDMVASPNAGYFVQGGQGRDTDAAGPAGSAVVAQVLADQLVATGVTPELIEFVGDDESPFIDEGIPVGGAENGDAEEKTAAQATAWGGRAGQVYDPCYHSACDRVDNVDKDVLDHYLRAVAGTVAHFATSTDELR
jgi:aminopeptidase S